MKVARFKAPVYFSKDAQYNCEKSCSFLIVAVFKRIISRKTSIDILMIIDTLYMLVRTNA